MNHALLFTVSVHGSMYRAELSSNISEHDCGPTTRCIDAK
jgi:hypothetical protein